MSKLHELTPSEIYIRIYPNELFIHFPPSIHDSYVLSTIYTSPSPSLQFFEVINLDEGRNLNGLPNYNCFSLTKASYILHKIFTKLFASPQNMLLILWIDYPKDYLSVHLT
ncbi:110aa long hypothetical protein [Pyrococcus horikoshii OT3]|uniref:Uncharacterized protein n=1 Tax=Pyrococcus horikoshii (strain ATCC 700860 / DSM 12428 / JCM 9974 / NBRC 100139 / OT-3) TaxID=70601 RepID=O58685_PYRHO|nr:110aa long hypothetical protein [Pyrococcus horikoshii OT3]